MIFSVKLFYQLLINNLLKIMYFYIEKNLDNSYNTLSEKFDKEFYYKFEPNDIDETFYSNKINPDLELFLKDKYIIIPNYDYNIQTNKKQIINKCIFCYYLNIFYNTNYLCEKYFKNITDYYYCNCYNLLSNYSEEHYFYKTYFLHDLTLNKAFVLDAFRLSKHYYLFNYNDYKEYMNIILSIFNSDKVIKHIESLYKHDKYSFKIIELNGSYKMSTLHSLLQI